MSELQQTSEYRYAQLNQHRRLLERIGFRLSCVCSAHTYSVLLRLTQIHSAPFGFTQSHSDPSHSDLLSLIQICAISRDLLSFMKVHSDLLRLTTFHSVPCGFAQCCSNRFNNLEPFRHCGNCEIIAIIFITNNYVGIRHSIRHPLWLCRSLSQSLLIFDILRLLCTCTSHI